MNHTQITRALHSVLRVSVLGLAILFGHSQNVNAQWAMNGNNINNTNSGNVGIGTATPETKLDVSGNVLNLGSDFGTVTRTNNTAKLNRLTMPPYTSGNLKLSVIAGATTNTENLVGVGGGAGGFAASTTIFFNTAANTNTDTGTERMRITSTGNIGIGVTAPDLPLDVRRPAFVWNSDTRAVVGAYDSTSMAQGVGGGIQFGGKFDTAGSTAGFASISGIKENGTNNDFSSALVFTTRVNPNAQAEKMRITSTGNVGLGTTNPLALASGTLTGRIAHISSADVTGLVLTGTFPEVLLYDSNGTANSRIFQMMQDGGLAKIRVINDAISALTLDNVQVWNLSTGNVGIGTSAPTAKLHVAGDGRVTGNLTVDGNLAAKYQDVAEWVPAAKALPPGTVVTLNPTQSNFVEASSKAYDTRVAGVISDQPGIALGEQGENKVLVATTGRVRMKVDATSAPIKIGDLLVTSDKEGVAMKSIPINFGGVEIHRPGTLIGKALEPLAKGEGEILVLLSLQ